MVRRPGVDETCIPCKDGCGPVEVPTKDEKEAMDALRKIKDRVREIKEEIENEAGGNSDLKEELKLLRSEWDAWQKRREQAARERMILLGHEDPD